MLVCLEEKIYWLIYRIILYLKKKKICIVYER